MQSLMIIGHVVPRPEYEGANIRTDELRLLQTLLGINKITLFFVEKKFLLRSFKTSKSGVLLKFRPHTGAKNVAQVCRHVNSFCTLIQHKILELKCIGILYFHFKHLEM